jgi:hypothetical protein
MPGVPEGGGVRQPRLPAHGITVAAVVAGGGVHVGADDVGVGQRVPQSTALEHGVGLGAQSEPGHGVEVGGCVGSSVGVAHFTTSLHGVAVGVGQRTVSLQSVAMGVRVGRGVEVTQFEFGHGVRVGVAQLGDPAQGVRVGVAQLTLLVHGTTVAVAFGVGVAVGQFTPRVHGIGVGVGAQAAFVHGV